MSLAKSGAPLRARRALVSCRRRLLRSEQQLREAEARLLAQRRSMAAVAHDLRAPLQTVNVALMLLTAEATPAMEKPLRLARASLTRASGLLSDLLDGAQLSQGQRLPLQKKVHDLSELVLGTLEDVRLRFPDRAIAHALPSAESWIEADAQRIAQVLDNLITNALVHGNASAPVDVEVDGDTQHVVLRVQNRGALSEAARASLFQPMARGVLRARRGSLGLGLYIVKQLVEAHDGCIEVSGDDQSTTFSVRLPRVRPD